MVVLSNISQSIKYSFIYDTTMYASFFKTLFKWEANYEGTTI